MLQVALLDFVFYFGYTKTARLILSQVVLDMIKKQSNKKNHLMKSSWNLGKTQTMRVPMLLKDHLMEIARHIDEGGTVEFLDKNHLRSQPKNNKTILSQDIIEDDKSEAIIEKAKSSTVILSQDIIKEIIAILKHGITSKKQGGVYNSSNASTLKKEVIKVLAILEK